MTVALWARLDSLQWSRGLSTAEGLERESLGHGVPKASMEPRSFDRGGGLEACGLANGLGGLQWSRGLSTAEGERGLRQRDGHVRASMEPRSFDRGGRDPDLPLALLDRGASMEPRSFDRGGTAPSALRGHRGQGASMEPRSFDRGGGTVKQKCLPAFSLQWSRGLSTAEGERAGLLRPSLIHASMEPRSFDRGGPRPRRLWVGPHGSALQWSRGLSTAEGG